MKKQSLYMFLTGFELSDHWILSTPRIQESKEIYTENRKEWTKPE